MVSRSVTRNVLTGTAQCRSILHPCPLAMSSGTSQRQGLLAFPPDVSAERRYWLTLHKGLASGWYEWASTTVDSTRREGNSEDLEWLWDSVPGLGCVQGVC